MLREKILNTITYFLVIGTLPLYVLYILMVELVLQEKQEQKTFMKWKNEKK